MWTPQRCRGGALAPAQCPSRPLSVLTRQILVACGILGFDGSHPWAMSLRGQRLLRGWTLSVLVGLSALYLWTRIFGLFISGFTGALLSARARSST